MEVISDLNYCPVKVKEIDNPEKNGCDYLEKLEIQRSYEDERLGIWY